MRFLAKREYLLAEPAAGLPWVLRIAAEHWASDFHVIRRLLDSIFIAYVQEGRLASEQQEASLEAGPGSVVCLTGGPMNIVARSREGVKLVIVVVQGALGRQQIETCLKLNHSQQFSLRNPAAVEALFRSMLEAAAAGGPESSKIVAGLLTPTLLTVKREHFAMGQYKDPKRELFEQCRRHIADRYEQIGSVAEVAEKFRISHARLCRLFRLYENCTPHQFLLKHKMTHALYALQHQDRSVGEVGYTLGFADPYSFSKTFKRVMGYSPSTARGK